MHIRADFLEVSIRVGLDLVDHVFSRDEIYLRPTRFSPAAARRLAAGLRALEAYLRRLILCLALQIEPDVLALHARPNRPGRRRWFSSPGFRVLTSTGAFHGALSEAPSRRRVASSIASAPLLARLDRLSALLKAPEARARSLARHLARRVSFVPIPDFGRRLGRRWRAEAGVIYAAMAPVIRQAADLRHPVQAPACWPPPRVRVV